PRLRSPGSREAETCPGPNGASLWPERLVPSVCERCKDHGPMASEPATAPIEYHAREGFLDEVFAGPHGSAAAHAAQLVAALEQMGPAHLAAAGRRRDAIFMQQGITFELTGEDGPKDRPFPLDLVPRIIPAEEWIPIK